MANYLTQFKDFINNMEERIKKIMINIINVSFGILILASIVLYLYIADSSELITYEAGLILFKTGIAIFSFGIVSSFAFENLRKRIF